MFGIESTTKHRVSISWQKKDFEQVKTSTKDDGFEQQERSGKRIWSNFMILDKYQRTPNSLCPITYFVRGSVLQGCGRSIILLPELPHHRHVPAMSGYCVASIINFGEKLPDACCLLVRPKCLIVFVGWLSPICFAWHWIFRLVNQCIPRTRSMIIVIMWEKHFFFCPAKNLHPQETHQKTPKAYPLVNSHRPW